jgi:hypothetical protein
MTMHKKKKTPRPVKPGRQEFRPWAGSNIRITSEAHRPLPAVFKDVVLTPTKGAA